MIYTTYSTKRLRSSLSDEAKENGSLNHGFVTEIDTDTMFLDYIRQSSPADNQRRGFDITYGLAILRQAHDLGSTIVCETALSE